MKSLFIIALLAFTAPGIVMADTRTASIYQLDIELEDQNGRIVKLDQFRGHPVLISMFYASCPHVCPLIISTIQLNEMQLDADQRKELRVLMVSIDPEHDKPSVLAALVDKQGIDSSRWSLVRSSESNVRKLAAVLGVRYRQLPDGQFNHSSLINLLDETGVQVKSSDKLAGVDWELLAEIKNQLTKP